MILMSVRVNKGRAFIILGTMVTTFVVLRVWLYFSPNSDFNIASYNIHHLYTGLVLVTFSGIFLVVMEEAGRRITDIMAVIFGSGLGMALDELVYLIATDGSNESYSLPVSFWGGLVAIAIASGYTLLLVVCSKRKK